MTCLNREKLTWDTYCCPETGKVIERRVTSVNGNEIEDKHVLNQRYKEYPPEKKAQKNARAREWRKRKKEEMLRYLEEKKCSN